MKYELVYFPHKSLETPTKKVEAFDAELHDLLDQMGTIMLNSNGIGLAANQVGSDKRLFIALNINGFSKKNKTIVEFINPEIVEMEPEKQMNNEGCLSLPDEYVQIPRSTQLTLKAQDRHGEEFTIIAHGIEAVCVQHEMEHLEGKAFFDHLNRQQRRAILKKIGK